MDPRQNGSRYGPPNRDGSRHAQQNSRGPPQRERSRDPGPGGRQVGPFLGGGGRDQPPQQVKVRVNYFRLKFIKDDQGEWIKYHVEIRDAMKTKKKNPDGTFVDPLEFEFVPRLVKRKDDSGNDIQVERTVDLGRGSTSLSRRILMKLQRNLLAENPPRTFVTDGEKQVYAPKRLFTKQLNLLPEGGSNDANKGSGTIGGIYGPADTGEHHNRAQAPQTGPFEDYYVRVPKDCDEDVDGAKMASYVVRLREVGRIGFHSVRQSLMIQVVEAGQRESMRQCLEIILKNQMMLTLECWGRSPRMFFFPDDVQNRIRGHKLMVRKPNESRNVDPFVGITQAVRFCTNGDIYVARDVGTRWFNLDKPPILLLDSHRKTFAGVDIGSCDKMIEDQGRRQKIQEALEKIVFHVKYTPKLDEEAKERIAAYHKKLNKSDEMIASIIESRIKRKKVYLNQSLITKHPKEKAIIWAADDETLHTFPYRGTEVTVYYYFLTHHGVKLKYPKMPVILTKNGHLPAEFLLQAKSPVRGANSNEQSQRVLGFHDEFAGGDKIRHLTETVDQLKRLQHRMQDMQVEPGLLDTRKFNFEVDDKPLEVDATLLPEPRLVFSNNRHAEIKNGSWNLNRAMFLRPADLPSFAVLDLAGDFVNILNQLLMRARSHGLVTPPCRDFTKMIENLQVEVKDLSPEMLSNAFREAIEKAKTFFLRDRFDFFRKHNIMFKSLYVSPEGVTTECLVYPLRPESELGDEQELFGLICPPEKVYATHMLKYDDKQCEARQVVTVKAVKDGLGHVDFDVDPFDFRWSSETGSGCSEAKIDGRWTPATFVRYGWKMWDGRVERDSNRIYEFLSCKAFQVECPAVIFINLPEKDPGIYHFLKLLSNFACRGIPSQCIVRDTYRRQQKPDQYFSNIALKLNTKLANKFNDACAWKIEGQGLSWVSNVPTLIMGLSMSRGAGKDSLTAVAASALLSLERGSQMRMAQVLKIQSQPDIVEDHVMRSITKTLTIQFYKHTGKLPKRVLIFRDGSSEGNFQELVDHEFANVHKGISEVMEKLFNDGVDCTEWRCCDCPDCGKSCASCEPKLTFTVCVNDHNVRVVPDTSYGRNKNVRSGTCIDREIMPVKWSPDKDKAELYGIQEQDQKDFLLTAQGGLKGTSKPVFYRVIIDKNCISPLLMQSIVYEMSFQYGTATKAVRKVPVVLYSKRLAETAVGFLAYIIGQRTAEGVDALCQVVDINSAGQDRSWVRREMEGDEDCDYAIRNELLPGFSPYETRFEDNSIWRTPFRTHLSS